GSRFGARCTQRDLRHAVLELDGRRIRIAGSLISPAELRPSAFLAGCPRLLSNALAYRLNRGLPLLVARSEASYVLRLGKDEPRTELVARRRDGLPIRVRFSGPAGRGSTRLTVRR